MYYMGMLFVNHDTTTTTTGTTTKQDFLTSQVRQQSY
jgi:hypothetical protein